MAAAPRRRRARASAPRRRRGRGRSAPHNVAIVPMYETRRRPRRYARAGYAMESPRATVGGLLLLGTGVILGAEAANLTHRYLSTIDPATTSDKLPQGINASLVPDAATYNDLAEGAKPGMASIFAQLGLAALGFVGGAFLPWAPVKFLAYGFGFGALGHVGVQIVNGYIVEPMLSVGTDKAGPRTVRMFAHEQKAIPALNPPSSGTSQGMGLGALPQSRRSGVAAALPVAQMSRTPHALASMGAVVPGPAPYVGPPINFPGPPTSVPFPPSMTPPTGGGPTNGGPQQGGCPAGSIPLNADGTCPSGYQIVAGTRCCIPVSTQLPPPPPPPPPPVQQQPPFVPSPPAQPCPPCGQGPGCGQGCACSSCVAMYGQPPVQQQHQQHASILAAMLHAA